MEASSSLPAVTDSAADPNLTALVDRARALADASLAPNSRRAYAADFADFSTWCSGQNLSPAPAPPQTVALYISALSGFAKASTIQRRLSAIARAHKDLGLESPVAHPIVRKVMSGVRRTNGAAPTTKVALSVEAIRKICAALPESTLGIRDRALLLVGFFTGVRRSELVGFDFEDVSFEERGAVLRVRRSKTDQEQIGRTIGIPYGRTSTTCPVRSLRSWLHMAHISTGPLFRPVNRHGAVLPQRLTDKAVARTVKRWARAVGMDSSSVAGHSLRAGLATSAAAAGASERSIMSQTGHRSEAMVRRYIRHGSVWVDNAALVLEL